MRFEEALKMMREGKKVAPKRWAIVLGEPEHLLILKDKLMYYSGITYHELPLSPKDILAEDWEVVDECK